MSARQTVPSIPARTSSDNIGGSVLNSPSILDGLSNAQILSQQEIDAAGNATSKNYLLIAALALGAGLLVWKLSKK